MSGERQGAERDVRLERDPDDLADACLAVWLTPGELQMRHEHGEHDLCPRTWCEVAAVYAQADEQCRRPRESSALRERLRKDAEASAKRPQHEKRHMPAITAARPIPPGGDEVAR